MQHYLKDGKRFSRKTFYPTKVQMAAIKRIEKELERKKLRKLERKS
jgi:hypothetical protein